MQNHKLFLKLGISLVILTNLFLLVTVTTPLEYFSLFSFFSKGIFNIIFSIFFLLVIWLQSKGEIVLYQLFLLFLFVDTIIVYHHKINFLLHVLAFAVISRLLLKVIKTKRTKKKLEDHLVE